FQQALPLHRQTGNRQFEANTLNSIGNVYADAGQPEKALDYYQQALSLRRTIGDRQGEARTLVSMTRAEQKLNRPAEAQNGYAEAVAMLETLRENLGGYSHAKQSFLASHLDVYHAYLHLLLERHQIADAFALAQKTKARVLLDLMYDGKVQLAQSLTDE